MDSFIYMVTQQTLKDQKESRAMGEEFHWEIQLRIRKWDPQKNVQRKGGQKDERTLRRPSFPGQGWPTKAVCAGALKKEPEVSRQELTEVVFEKAFCCSGYSLTCRMHFYS